MSFLNSLNCAFGGCASNALASDFHAVNVSNMFKAKINVSCDTQISNSQTMACGLTSSHCSHLKMTCGNSADLTASCSMAELVDAATDTLMKSEDPGELKKALNLGSDASPADIQNAITQEINDSCSSTAAASQSINSGIFCDYSDYVTATVFSQMNVQTACTAAAMLGVSARTPAKSYQILKIVVFIIGGILLLIYLFILVVIIIKIRDSGKKLNP